MGGPTSLQCRKGEWLLKRLQELKSEFPKLIGDIAGIGMALRVEICEEDGFTPDRTMVESILREAMKGDIKIGAEEYGLVLDVGGYYKNVLTLSPALTITEEEMELAAALLREVLKRVSRSSNH